MLAFTRFHHVWFNWPGGWFDFGGNDSLWIFLLVVAILLLVAIFRRK